MRSHSRNEALDHGVKIGGELAPKICRLARADHRQGGTPLGLVGSSDFDQAPFEVGQIRSAILRLNQSSAR
jgi:hypothetical protein